MSTVAFYSGELMSPEAIRAAYPEARFIARASVLINGQPVADRFAPVIDQTVWGIAVDIGSDLPGETILATADDGRSLRVVLAEPLLSGDPATVLANARYWELPPAFVAALQSVVLPGQVEE
ncbi:MAG TPA: hypothetical protein VHR64_09995 [Thermomicrobiales bacterium]|nr:hypothetical protein [Thermomicrobiales bacterium]